MSERSVAVITAMSDEYNLVRGSMSDIVESDARWYTLSCGTINNRKVFLQKCSIGKVSAAIAATDLILNYKPDIIINTGMAGGIDDSLNIGDFVAGSYTLYHDLDFGTLTSLKDDLAVPLEIEGNKELLSLVKSISKNIKYGKICTGDQFISDYKSLSIIKNKYPDALAVDMESCSIAHACYLYNIPFISLRVISDTPSQHNNSQQFVDFLKKADSDSFNIIKELLSVI